MKLLTAWFTLLIVSLLCMAASVSAASPSIQLFLNGKSLEAEVPPRIVNDITLVPVRVIAESLGSKVSWDGKQRKVTVEKPGTKITLIIDKKEATVNGVAVPLEAAPMIDSGNTMLPIRFVSEQLGTKVTWDNLTRSVFLYNSEKVSGVETDTDKPVTAKPDDAKPEEKPDTAKPNDGKEGAQNPASSTNDGKTGGDKSGQNPAAGEKDGAAVPATDSKPNEPVKAGDGSGDWKSSDNTGGPTLPPPAPSSQAGASTAKKFVLEGVTLKDDTLGLKTSGDGAPEPNVFYLDNPQRVVIDLPGAQLSAALQQKVNAQNEGKLPDSNALVKQIRYSLFSKEPSIVRIVIDLPQKTSLVFSGKSAAGELTGKLTPVKTRYKVVIDPGHGGKDTGAISITKRREKDIVLGVGTKVAKLLAKEPAIDVRMTRSDDTFIELDGRTQFANDLNADLFVSIHANSASKETIGGTETYYYTEQSLSFAKLIHQALVEATGFADRKVKQERFYVIKNTDMPSVLLELGFLTNANEDSQMVKDAFQDRVAASIVAAIKKQLNLN